MLMSGLIVFGGISFMRMGISQLPDVDYPVVSVNIRLEGVIKDAAFTLEGDIRAGIEFVGLSEAERAITAVLGGINRIESEYAVPKVAR